LLERDGELRITVPVSIAVSPAELAAALST
jgi:hypothetical protein